MAYASPYYDPVKAHEYYMEHRELKGRKRKTSTVDLNETGKTAASVVKENLNKEKQERAKQITEDCSKKVSQLRELLKSMNKATKEASRPVIEAAIAKLKEQSAAAKEALGLEYENKYADEMGKLKQDSSMKRTFERGSTQGLNAEGREAARQVKEKLNEERNEKIQTYKDTTQKLIEDIRSKTTSKREQTTNDIAKAREDLSSRKEARRNDLDSYKSKTNSQIEAIRNRLSGMTKKQRAQNKEKLLGEIAKLQNDNKEKTASYKAEVDKDRADTNASIASIRESYKSYSSEASSQIKLIRQDNTDMRKSLTNEYKERYYDEVDRIREDEDMRDY